jgi:hypothetical protein
VSRYRLIALGCLVVAVVAYLVDVSIVGDNMSSRDVTFSDVLGVVLAISLVVGIAAAAVAQVRTWKGHR